jgi:two-component system sensor histidine kinase NreB
MAQDLRPSVLDDLGLVPALRTLARQGAGPEVRLQVEGLHGRLPLPIETALYRIAQEALINAVKYARADHIDIRLEAHDGTGVRLSVRDDGVGFDPRRLPPTAEAGRAGLGLFGMRERATLLHGTLEVHSQPAKGTEIIVQLPLEETHAA